MNHPTRIEPLTEARAAELFAMLKRVGDDPQLTLSLDTEGRVVNTVTTDREDVEHAIGDFDVHA